MGGLLLFGCGSMGAAGIRFRAVVLLWRLLGELGRGVCQDWILVGGFGTRLRAEGGDSLSSEISGLGLGLAAAAELMSTGRFQVTPKCIVECTSHYAAAFRDIVKSIALW